MGYLHPTMKQADLSLILPDMLPRLWSFAFRLSRDRYDAEELVQRACIRGLERAHQLLPDTSVLNWMSSIVHSTWSNDVRQRAQRYHLYVEWNDALLETLADPASASETDKVTQQIADAVDQLPEAQRVVLLAVSLEGLSYQEAADMLSVPVGTIMSRLSRARKAVSVRLGEDNKPAMPSSRTASRNTSHCPE